MAAFLLAFVLTAPVPRWVQQPPRPPVVRVQKPPRRKRVRRVVHRKPPTVWVTPDVVEVFPDWWTAERAAMKTLAAWCVGVAIQ